MPGFRALPALALAAFTILAPAASGQTPGSIVRAPAGARYDAGALHRWLFGNEYRDLWTTPIAVEVLNLATFAGGLSPTTAVIDGAVYDLRDPTAQRGRAVGRQTLSVRFRAQDGYEYGFRSVDKDPDILPENLRATFVQDVIQDQISAAHPAGPPVTAALMEAAGILHSNPRLVMLPDDPVFGPFRARLAGVIGYIERRMITAPGLPPFAGATEIIRAEDILARLRAHPRERVDLRAFLRARLFDVFIGDWDRHRDQWSWARFGSDTGAIAWVPIPEDRDWAFAYYDGFMLVLARREAPELVKFGPAYPSIFGLNWNGREFDRIMLPGLSKADWDSVAVDLQDRFTDRVLEDAVARMPAEYFPADSARMVASLKSRRDRLPAAAAAFFRMLSRELDLYGTDASEVATVEYRKDGSVEVAIRERSAPGDAYLRRRFARGEAGQVRLHLLGGDDSIVVRGPGVGLDLRIVPGGGRDVLIDSAKYRPTRFYTEDGDRVDAWYRVRVDRRRYVAPLGPRGRPAIDWGRRWLVLPQASFSPELGPFVGASVNVIDHGFRFHPYAARVFVHGGYAAAERTGAGGVLGIFYLPNSRLRWEVEGDATGLEIIRFHGFGNETSAAGDGSFFRVDQVQLGIRSDLVWDFGTRSAVGVGGIYRYSNTLPRPGTFVTDQLPGLYGSDRFWSLGMHGRVTLDFRDRAVAASQGVLVDLGGTYVFPRFSVDSGAYGDVHGVAAAYVTAGGAPLRPTLAVRAGGKKVFGTYPFFDAAFLGGSETVRLGRANRFAGDAAVWGSAELRLRLGSTFLLVPGEFGIHGLADAGRVFVAGESSTQLHTAFGGGVWLAFLDPAGTVSISAAQSSERLGIYVQAGFAF